MKLFFFKYSCIKGKQKTNTDAVVSFLSIYADWYSFICSLILCKLPLTWFCCARFRSERKDSQWQHYLHAFIEIYTNTHCSGFISKENGADRRKKQSRKRKKCIEQLSWVYTQLSRLILSRLCSNEDLQWTPQSPRSATDSRHTHFPQRREGRWRRRALLSFLSLSFSCSLSPLPPTSPPLIILHSRGVTVALCVHCLMLFKK